MRREQKIALESRSLSARFGQLFEKVDSKSHCYGTVKIRFLAETCVLRADIRFKIVIFFDGKAETGFCSIGFLDGFLRSEKNVL